MLLPLLSVSLHERSLGDITREKKADQGRSAAVAKRTKEEKEEEEEWYKVDQPCHDSWGRVP